MQFVFELNQVGIDKNTAEFAFDQIYSKILQDTEQDDIIDILMTALESRKFLYPTSNDKFTQKLAFAKKYSKLLQEFGKEISKREQIDVKNLYDIAISFDIFGHDISMKISKYLFQKMFDDRELLKDWKCKKCHFANCELMVDGLWRLYNQLNKCGLCGNNRVSTKHIEEKHTIKENLFESTKANISLPQCVTESWLDVCDLTCTVLQNDKINMKDLSHKQFLYLLKQYWFDQIKEGKKKQLLNHYKDTIIASLINCKMNGRMFDSMPKKHFLEMVFAYCNDKTLTAALAKLYTNINKFDLDAVELPSNDDMYDVCPAMNRINIIIQYFEELTCNLHNTNNRYPYSMKSFVESLPEYTPVKLLNDIQHIIEHQFKDKNRSCKMGNKCIHLKRALRDRDSPQCKLLHVKKELFNTDNPQDFIYISMLDRAHYILMHDLDIADMTDNTSNGLQLLQHDVKSTEMHVYSTGIYMEYHTLKPLYTNLAEEVTQNKMCSITKQQFETEMQSVNFIMESNKYANDLRSYKTDKRYGIKIDERMHSENILCVFLYCNHSQLCEKFRQSYRNENYNDLNEVIIKRHCHNFYWFGRFLTTAIEFWGQTPRRNDRLYHGLSQKFLFNEFSTVYEIPTSTTGKISVAHGFAKDGGIVIQLAPKWKKEINSSKYLDVSIFSDFKHEQEKLFAGMTVLSIINIYNPSDNKWDGYSEYIRGILYFERITEQTVHQKDYYNYGVITNKKKDEWTKIQNDYLVPLIKSVCNNCDEFKSDSTIENRTIPTYILKLFKHFCHNKRDYIDLSCIDGEIDNMTQQLKNILFKEIKMDTVEDKLTKYQINNKNIRLIFPNLKQYKNSLGHWID
eukprot:418285_1